MLDREVITFGEKVNQYQIPLVFAGTHVITRALFGVRHHRFSFFTLDTIGGLEVSAFSNTSTEQKAFEPTLIALVNARPNLSLYILEGTYIVVYAKLLSETMITGYKRRRVKSEKTDIRSITGLPKNGGMIHWSQEVFKQWA
jgi:hypothetical protein